MRTSGSFSPPIITPPFSPGPLRRIIQAARVYRVLSPAACAEPDSGRADGPVRALWAHRACAGDVTLGGRDGTQRRQLLVGTLRPRAAVHDGACRGVHAGLATEAAGY